MFNEVFQTISGIDNYGLFSTFIFVVFFGLVVVHTMSICKKDVSEFSRLPFDDQTKDSNDV
jgi:hypothetical protein